MIRSSSSSASSSSSSPPSLISGTGETGRLLQLFRETRSRTMLMVSTLEPDDFVVQTAFFTSPAKWHVGHVSWIYEAVMGKMDGRYGFEEGEISAYLNSYYQQFGVPHDKGRRGTASRPTTKQMLEYFENVSGRVERFIAEHADRINAPGDGGGPSAVARLLEMGIHHECQHQELLVYDLQHMLADRYIPAVGLKEPPPRRPVAGAGGGGIGGGGGGGAPEAQGACRMEGGLYTMGYGGSDYCYDIELPEHPVYVRPYRIDAHPITNGQYMEFIRDGGYRSYQYWLSDGWEKVKENGWEAPMYWERVGDGGSNDQGDTWHIHDFAGLRRVNPHEPVSHVSYYEADAYCKWAGKRLPTEAEWEMAACWDAAGRKKSTYPWGDGAPTPERCNLLESGHWRCAEVGAYPGGASPCGCQQMIGDVWEWTSSEFIGYPGFKPTFSEYNDKWFANQKVLRGGSFGTPAASIRASYRNFFRLDERWMIAGFRCASDDNGPPGA